MNGKVKEWSDELPTLCEFAISQPHAAFSALTHGLFGRWIYLSRTLPNISESLSPLEQNIRLHFLPTLTGKCAFSDLERQLLSLPSRLSGLGIINPCASSVAQFDSSQKVTGPLVSLLIEQITEFTVTELDKQFVLKQEIYLKNRRSCEELSSDLHPQLSLDLQRAREFACLKRASSWLTALPIDEHGFALHKSDFRDAVCLRYGWPLLHLPTECICGTSFILFYFIFQKCAASV